jgi:hypothetical protein
VLATELNQGPIKTLHASWQNSQAIRNLPMRYRREFEAAISEVTTSLETMGNDWEIWRKVMGVQLESASYHTGRPGEVAAAVVAFAVDFFAKSKPSSDDPERKRERAEALRSAMSKFPDLSQKISAETPNLRVYRADSRGRFYSYVPKSVILSAMFQMKRLSIRRDWWWRSSESDINSPNCLNSKTLNSRSKWAQGIPGTSACLFCVQERSPCVTFVDTFEARFGVVLPLPKPLIPDGCDPWSAENYIMREVDTGDEINQKMSTLWGPYAMTLFSSTSFSRRNSLYISAS